MADRAATVDVELYLRRWSLQLDGPAMVGNNALVQPVRTRDSTAAVLRIGDPSGDSAQAWRALQLWGGDGAVRMYRYDAERDVLLLERLDHTRNLDVLPIGQAVAVAGSLRARLVRPAPEGLRTLRDLAATWEQRLRSAPGLPADLVDLADRAAGLCRELGPAAGGYLVNPDLHYHNVLAADREPWLVIDPMPLAGDREFGLASLIWGRLEESDTHRLLSQLIEIGGLDADRARAWALVESTAKLQHAAGRVARNCEAVAHDLYRATSPIRGR